MCSIYGGLGDGIGERVRMIGQLAKDRGRDGGRLEKYQLPDDLTGWLGNHRATPTTELEKGPLQPYDGMVHNGTIANDKELGGKEGEIDSQVLARVIVRTGPCDLASSLEQVQGSYALACTNGVTILLACNYKPLWYYKDSDQNVFFSSLKRHLSPVLPWGQSPVQLPPYSTLDLRTKRTGTIFRETSNRVVVVCSGGLDSVTAAWKLKNDGYEVSLLHFQYGCKAEGKELTRVRQLGDRLGASVAVVPIPSYALHGGGTLTEAGDHIVSGLAGAEYAHEWVPARNLVMASLAIAYAEATGHHYVALGNNLEESGAYPDNEEQMFLFLDQVADYAVQNGYSCRVITPVGHLMKHEIVKMGLALGVPYELTWSCYRGGDQHCGNCGPCLMRKIAFQRNGTTDPVQQVVG